MDEFIKNSDTLLDEHELSDKDQREIERETESLNKRWDKVKLDAISREPRLEYRRSVKNRSHAHFISATISSIIGISK